MHRICLAIVAVATCALIPIAAHARWPTPAGGDSASGDPEVLFTFDDGPHERHTATILDELARRRIQVIFFWVGRRLDPKGKGVDQRVAVVERAVREGHLVGNHTVTHPNLCMGKAAQAAEEIDENARRLTQASQLPQVLFRAPYGSHCKRIERMLDERAISHLHWDIDPQEWEHHDVERTARYVIRKLDRLEGRAIVLMHDTHLTTARALPKILDWIEDENARRAQTGKRPPIRILGASELVVERMDQALLQWAGAVTADPAEGLLGSLARLIP